jgi:peptide-methionine (S)-S-oxide reductase
MVAGMIAFFALAIQAPAPAGRAQAASANAVAVLAGGCFWCMEHDFEHLPGVINVVSGYSGGSRPNPNYENYHDTNAAFPIPHAEVVQITYDPAKVGYAQLLDFYFRHIDPTDGGGQFCDRGPAYSPIIFTGSAEEKQIAEAKKIEVGKLLKQKIAVRIVDAMTFWPAEDYHQHYSDKNSLKYKFYRWNCGRDQRVAEVWSAATN